MKPEKVLQDGSTCECTGQARVCTVDIFLFPSPRLILQNEVMMEVSARYLFQRNFTNFFIKFVSKIIRTILTVYLSKRCSSFSKEGSTENRQKQEKHKSKQVPVGAFRIKSE